MFTRVKWFGHLLAYVNIEKIVLLRLFWKICFKLSIFKKNMILVFSLIWYLGFFKTVYDPIQLFWKKNVSRFICKIDDRCVWLCCGHAAVLSTKSKCKTPTWGGKEGHTLYKLLTKITKPSLCRFGISKKTSTKIQQKRGVIYPNL